MKTPARLHEVLTTLISAAILPASTKQRCLRLLDCDSRGADLRNASIDEMVDALKYLMIENPPQLPASRTALSNHSRAFREVFKLPRNDRLEVIGRAGLVEIKNALGKGFNYHLTKTAPLQDDELSTLGLALKAQLSLAGATLPANARALSRASVVFSDTLNKSSSDKVAILERAGIVEVDLEGASMYYAADALNF